MTDVPIPDPGAAGPGRGWLSDLARAAAAPVACAAVLTGLLSGWVAAGGAGTISRVRIQVTLADVPMPSFTAGPGAARAGAYITIRNLSGSADELTGASSPAARRVLLIQGHDQGGGAGQGSVAASLPIPARSVTTLTPFGSDVVLTGTRGLMAGQHIPLTLVFRRAGRVTIEVRVTAPGAP